MKLFSINTSIALSLFCAQAFAAPVNINQADAAELDQALNGVGPVIAERIVTYRELHGGFNSAEELKLVKGVGSKLLEKNSGDILLN